MYNSYTETPSKIETRRARIISSLPPRNAWEPTLEECLEMEADIEAEIRERRQRYWAGILQSLQEATA